MLKNSLFLLVMVFLLAACGGQKAENTDNGAEDKTAKEEKVAKLTDGMYTIEDGSTLNWEGKKATYGHVGTIAVSSGELNVEGGAITSGSFEVDMTSIENTDVEDEEKRNDLVGHLASADFFDSEQFPTASFTITKVSPVTGKEGVTHKIEGDLTLKGKTNPVSFDAMVSEEAGAIMTKAKFVINRALWNVEFNSKDFPAFANLAADKIISNDIGIEFDLKAVKAEM